MRHFLIGDVQGCRAALEDLLVRIAFDPATDHVFFAGDLVARGPDSLGTLRLIKNLGSGLPDPYGANKFIFSKNSILTADGAISASKK